MLIGWIVGGSTAAGVTLFFGGITFFALSIYVYFKCKNRSDVGERERLDQSPEGGYGTMQQKPEYGHEKKKGGSMDKKVGHGSTSESSEEENTSDESGEEGHPITVRESSSKGSDSEGCLAQLWDASEQSGEEEEGHSFTDRIEKIGSEVFNVLRKGEGIEKAQKVFRKLLLLLIKENHPDHFSEDGREFQGKLTEFLNGFKEWGEKALKAVNPKEINKLKGSFLQWTIPRNQRIP